MYTHIYVDLHKHQMYINYIYIQQKTVKYIFQQCFLNIQFPINVIIFSVLLQMTRSQFTSFPFNIYFQVIYVTGNTDCTCAPLVGSSGTMSFADILKLVTE